MAAFSYVLDTCRVNASTVFALNKGQDPRKQKSFNFELDLASQLILSQIKQRQLTGLQLPVIRKIAQMAETAQMAEWYGASVSRAVDSGLIPSRVKPMTLKLIFTASLLDVQH